MKNEKVQKKRVVVWEKTDRAGNETAFASIDLRAQPVGETPPTSGTVTKEKSE